MYVRVTLILVREGDKVIRIDSAQGARDRGTKIRIPFARGDYARDCTIYFYIVVISPCRAEEEDVDGKVGYDGLSGGVREDCDTKTGRVELVEEGMGKRMPAGGKRGPSCDLVDGEVIKGTTG
ncbi:hypothetical protein CBR_g38462 [Chara braunii]|uniref:Uncharacterized protein n=1 Tax=Chara braunii TaxID=69332 RepID=A0A388JNS3_CHABU|nr:hypothetical protein CBR_g38462 [Chara braunii]|eukprot:GBG59437.1 hypothetical protein CBR_g38462 [Chara braunii]